MRLRDPCALVTLAAIAACARPPPPEQKPPEREGPPPPLRPVAFPDEPHRAAVVEWMVTDPFTDGDPIEERLERGELGAYPSAGTDATGVRWRPLSPDDSGVLPNVGQGTVYAVAHAPVPQGRRLFARTGPTTSVWSNGVRQPGDVYHSGRMKVPLASEAGDNLVAVQVAGWRGAPRLELWTTPDEVVFNFDDMTFPDPIAGDASEQWLGVPVLNLARKPLFDLRARAVGSAQLEDTITEMPAIGEGAVTQLAFRLKPRQPFTESADVPVTVRVESLSLDWSYERTVSLKVKPAGEPFRRTRRSAVDGSVQYYGVMPPSGYDPAQRYALVLSLHGAGVDAIGQAQAYSPKEWAFVIAPTNRRPFGFDWEEWGRLDGIEALDHAMEAFPIDPTRVYLTGHSMGGHGTWQLGVLKTGRFAVVAPSAGWGSFYSYTGRRRPAFPFARAQASSDTNVYVPNLARRGVYIIHGSADDNVPVREGRDMYDLVRQYTSDVVYFEQPGAGHWWDGDASPGADCVDWPPLFQFMQGHTLDPHELEFSWKTPSPWVNATHSFVTVQSVVTPSEDATVASAPGPGGDTVTVTTANVRSLDLDGAALQAKGVTKAVVDGVEHAVPDGVLALGPQEGKRAGRQGPYNQVYHRPWCWVWADDGPRTYARYAAYLTSYWTLYGNGQACALPLSRVSDELRAERNLVYLGVPSSAVGGAPAISWDAAALRVGEKTYAGAAVALVFPEGDRLAAAVAATAGDEHLVFRLVPFSSGAAIPDYFVWTGAGGVAAGFFDNDWKLDKLLGVP